MTRKRFEEIRSLLHFKNNNLMLPTMHPQHDRAFEVRPVLEHFNSAFICAMASTRPLIGSFSNRKRAIPAASIETTKRQKLIRQVVQHTMIKETKRQRCKLCTKSKTTNLTFNKYAECNVYLCFVNSRNCFKTYYDCRFC